MAGDAMIEISINGRAVDVEEGATILAAAVGHDVYVPALCHHPDLPPFRDLPLAERVCRGDVCHENEPVSEDTRRDLEGCGLCVVEVDGQTAPVRACCTPVAAGMSITTDSDAVKEERRVRLMKIMNRHPHACLTCAQREGCSLEDCSSNVPKDERCCNQFHDCELRRVAEYVGVKQETQRYRPAGLAVLTDEPLFSRDFNLCIDCSRCVRACNQVRGVEALGIVHRDGGLVVGSVAPTLIESQCKFCGACVEVCPTGCLTDNVSHTGDREKWLVPCVGTCPADVDVPGYIRRIASGDLRGAAALVWEKLPLANVLGHICFHDCERECRRGEVDEPIAICALKRFAMENGDGELLSASATFAENGRKVAVVGAGPAGLSAAYFLRFKGYGVTVFEAAAAPGGMPAQSIPAYRLPQSVLDKDVAVIRKLGVEITTGCEADVGEMTTRLRGDGFDAVLVAVGLPESKKIPVSGSDLGGVFWGLDFLSRAKAGESFDLGKRIVVVGGGNVAMDVAMTALRLASRAGGGRPAVSMFCLESREEMPAHAQEIEKAEVEGIEVNPGWGPAEIVGDAGNATGVVFRRCVSVFDEQRRFAPAFDDGDRTTAQADTVILAIGQAAPEGVPAEEESVFQAGDISRMVGGGSAVGAVASGRAAAERIDRYLGGDGDLSIELGDYAPPDAYIGREDGFAPRDRVPFPCAAPEDRCADFRLIDETYARDSAAAEARRCLQCDLRLLISRVELPPEKWLAFDSDNVESAPAVEGVFILADADKKPVAIKGAEDIRAGLLEKLASPGDARFFQWEEDRMYTKRESELIQQHLTQYGEMPGGGDDELDDLF